jgi:hypothetical protein
VLSEEGRTVTDGFTLLKAMLAEKSSEVVQCHIHTVEEDLEVVDLDST